MKTIVIDAGHGGYDNGAINGNRKEKDDNLRLSLAVAQRLSNKGQNVVLTRSSDVFVPLNQRSAISNRANADAFVSIHRNSAVSPQANGVENIVYTSPSATSVNYATKVLNNVVDVGVQSNRGLKQNNFAVLRNTVAPSQLLEMGFISNAADNTLFDRNFDAYADAIANGILSALGETDSSNSSVNKIKAIQQTLNNRYGTGLTADGIAGARTKTALVRALQRELNIQYGAALATDGIFGARTKAKIPVVKLGAKGNITYLIQAALIIKGFNTIADGNFGSSTQNTLKQFQQSVGITPDGIFGSNTADKLFRF